MLTQSLRFKARHAGLDAKFFCLPIRRDDDAIAVAATADPKRPTTPRGMLGFFATGEKTIAINVQNPVIGASAQGNGQ